MSVQNSATSYGMVAKFLHWVIAFGIITLVGLGFLMGTLKSNGLNELFYMLHKSIGLSVLFLMIVRLMWRTLNLKPQLSHLPLWQQRSANLSHALLYLLLIVMPLSGWVMSVAGGYIPEFFNLFTLSLPIAKNNVVAEQAAFVHKVLAWVLIGAVSLHILAALKHYFVDKDDILQRMLPTKNKSTHIQTGDVSTRSL